MICSCCAGYYEPKPGRKPDPQRDTGFGYCERCRPRIVSDWVRWGFPTETDRLTQEEAEARMERMA
jgi:hypothetical protein